MLGIGLSVWAPSPLGAASYSFTNAEAAAYVAAMPVQPDNTRKALIDTFVGALKSAGIWDSLDLLYLLASHDASAAPVNLKSPGTFDAVAVNSPAFVTDRGYTGDGSTSRLRTQYTPSTDGVNFTQNDASLWVWCTTNVQSNASDIGSVSMNPASRIGSRRSSSTANNQQITLNNSPTDTTAQAASGGTSIGFNGGQRVDASTLRLWKNGAQIGGDIAVASTGLPAQEQWVCGANNTGFSPRQIAAAAWGASLSGNEAAFYNAMLAYMQGVGAA